jgi:WD40 repeat protein
MVERRKECILTRNHTGRFVTLVVLLLVALSAAVLLPRLVDAQADPTLDAAVQQAFTATAAAAGAEQTAVFQQTVDAAVMLALTATAQAQEQPPPIQQSPAATPQPAQPVDPGSAPVSEVATLKGHKGAVNAVSVGVDGLIATAGEDATVRVWDLTTGGAPMVLEHDTPLLDVALHPTAAEVIASGTNGKVYRWDITSGEALPVSEAYVIVSDNLPDLLPSQGAVLVGFSPDGTRFATFDFNGLFGVWTYPQVRAKYSARYNFVLANFTSGTAAYTTPDEPANVKVAPLDDLTAVQQIFAYDSAFAEPVAFSRDGSRLLVLSDDNLIYAVNPQSGESLYDFTYTGYGLAALSPDSALIVDGGEDGTVSVLDGSTGELLGTLAGHTAPITESAFSADGTRFATASEDGTVKVWRVVNDGAVTAATEAADAPPAEDSSPGEPTPLPEGFPDITDAEVQVAEQVFEGGRMFWVGPVNQLWVMIVNEEGSGQWLIYEDTFVEGEDMEEDPSIEPPEGRYEPVRGFGKLWRENPEVRDALGWAVTPEFGYVSRYRYVPGGEMVNGVYQSGPGYHVLFSLNGEAFRFDEANSIWRLGGG